jgi:Zn-dependent peptidase ImmA (M78 family)
MSQSDLYIHAAWAAEQVIRDLKLAALPIDPIAIAQERQIEVMAKPASVPGVSGMFLRLGNHFGIAYATHIDNIGFQHFSVAHELGHYYLPGHIDAVLGSREIHESYAGFITSDRYELEADHFAAALLMPASLFTPAMRRAGEGLVAVEHLKAICETSLTATAIRMVQCSRDPLAMVVSTGLHIDYCFMSDALKDFQGIDWIRKGQALPQSSPTFLFNRDPQRIARAERADGTSDIQDWFGGNRSIEICEDVIGLGSYGKTLTVLYGFQLPDEDEDEEDDGEPWERVRR